MDTYIFNDFLNVIRKNYEQRASLLRQEYPDIAYDQWQFTDLPFINELCLLVLIALRHQIERELVGLAARATGNGEEITGQQYTKNVEKLRIKTLKGNNTGWKWNDIESRLKLHSFENYKLMDALRLLVNLYKHDPTKTPSKELLKYLKLDIDVPYAPITESEKFRKGLASFIGLVEDADFCNITERFVEIANDFLTNVESKVILSKVNLGFVPINPNTYLQPHVSLPSGRWWLNVVNPGE